MEKNGIKITITITMRDALEDFIVGRVMGDEPLAVEEGRCVYNHRAGGGCAVGKHLPEKVAEYLFGVAGDADVIAEMRKAGFEEPKHRFWRLLQMAHDKLGCYINSVSVEKGEAALQMFQSHMSAISELQIG